jgi:hypothetical protein
MNSRTLKVIDYKNRELTVTVSWLLPVGGLLNREIDNPFLFWLEKASYKGKPITNRLSKWGIRWLEDEALRILIDEGAITSINDIN